MNLVDLKKNTTARITTIDAETNHTDRLHAMGIFVGSTVQKPYESRSNGPVFVATQHGCTFAIGYDLASKIFIAVE